MQSAKSGLSALCLLALACTFGVCAAEPPQKTIKVTCDYPGGNVRVLKIDEQGGVLNVAPDLRDTKGHWFHFDFTVKGAAGRKLRFQFPQDNNPYLSSLGPAICSDGGKSWRWLNQNGQRHEPANRFDYVFGPDEDDVRFAMSIPYSQMHWDAFMKPYRDNPGVKFETLCKSQSGTRETEMVRVPCRGKAEYLLVLTARHHACETTGNPPMEGAFTELMSGSAEGNWLRDHADCVFVPFMDKDGVENGDQGKDRNPWDHNRDYLKGRYTSVRALKDLITRESAGRRIVYLDLHSPYVRSFKSCPEQDQVFTFGIKDPDQNARWDAFRRNWIEAQKNGALKYTGKYDIFAGTGHAAVTEKAARAGFVGSRHWVSEQTNCWFSTCVEFGYSLCGGVNSVAGMRELGSNMLKAVVRTIR